jgi:membrane protease YdiL (CAAX protease family)
MLFAVKNLFWPSLLLLGVLLAVFFAVKSPEAQMISFHSGLLVSLAGGIGLMAASDIFLHTLFRLVLGTPYRKCYAAFVEYFRPQGAREIIAGGLLAGGEELIFRGILLQVLISSAGLRPYIALAISSLVFALFHLLPARRLWPFALWALWEGGLLGWVYLWSGSLLVCVVLHILHDVAGFCLLAWQRRTGWLL